MTDDYEPRQVREEAAVNNSICITKQSGLITFSCLKIIPISVQRRTHDQGIFLIISYLFHINIPFEFRVSYEQDVRRSSIHRI